jgi:hypothetical protein
MNKHVESGSVSEFVDVTVKISGVQKLLEEAGQKAPNDSSVGESASISRPFVSPLAWALYSAHSSIIWHAVMTMVGWKNGVSTKLLKNDELVDAIKKVLPHQNEFLEKFGVGGTYFLLDEVEEGAFNRSSQHLIFRCLQ